MMSLIVTSMMAMSLVVAGSYVAFTTLQSSQRLSDVQRNSAQMTQLAALVQANLRPVKGDAVLYPPAPAVDKDGRTTLPVWLAPEAKTPWGAPYGYCVYAPAPAAAATAVTTQPYPYAGAPGARDYAVAAPALPTALAGRDIVALILAPAVKSDKAARCEDVVLDQGQPGLSGGGQVLSIGQRATSDLAALSSAARVERYVTPAPTGTGTGATLADGMSLEAALGFWLAARPNTMVLRLAPGRHPLGAALLAALADDGQTPAGGRLVLSALEAGAVIAAQSPGAVLTVPGDLRLDGVGLDGLGVEAMPGTRLELRGRTAIAAPAGVPAVRSSHATLLVGGALSVSSDGDAIRVDGGRALFRDADVAAVVGRGGSAVTSSLGATVAFASVKRRPSLSVSGRGTPLAAIRAGGALTVLDHTDIALNDATQFGTVLEGGGFEMTATTLGQPSARAAAGGVLDLGGSRVASDAVSQVWLGPGARCASGALFDQRVSQQTAGVPAAGAPAAAAVAMVSTASTANRAGWTCRN